MRIKLLIILILPLMLLECQSSIWIMLTKKESKLYTEVEKLMLNETTASIDFKFGYDPDLEIDYVYKAGTFSDKEVSAKSPEMKKALTKYKSEEIISFYEKIVQMKETQVWKMNLFKSKKNWVELTYIQKYTLPETEQFLNILEKNVIQLNTGYAGGIDNRKDEIKKHTADKLQKELEAKEKERQKSEKF